MESFYFWITDIDGDVQVVYIQTHSRHICANQNRRNPDMKSNLLKCLRMAIFIIPFFKVLGDSFFLSVWIITIQLQNHNFWSKFL